MQQIKIMLDKIRSSDNYTENAQLLSVCLNYFQREKKQQRQEDLLWLKEFVFTEIYKLIDAIPKTNDHKLKDKMFDYEDKLVGLVMLLIAQKCAVSDSERMVVTSLVKLVAAEQPLENEIDNVFKAEKIEKSDITAVLDIARGITDEYRKGVIYNGLLRYKDGAGKMTADAKGAVTEYIAAELGSYLKKESLSEDEINCLEVAADVCKYYISDSIIEQLSEIVWLKYNNVRYYAIETLLKNGQKIDASIIAEMAADLEYAVMTYSLVQRHGQAGLFPRELINPEYLAKSDMVHWLVYPTELGKQPDAIELLGDVTVKKEHYYVFKFMSDSDTLDDESKNVWLVGWSSSGGGTFSHFSRLSEVEKKTPQKTLKNIRKKLLG